MSFRGLRLKSSSLPSGLLKRALCSDERVYRVKCGDVSSIGTFCRDKSGSEDTCIKVSEFVGWWADMLRRKSDLRWKGDLPSTCPPEFNCVLIFENAEELGDNCDDSESECSSNEEEESRPHKKARVEKGMILLLLGEEPLHCSDTESTAAPPAVFDDESDSSSDSNFDPDSESSSEDETDTDESQSD